MSRGKILIADDEKDIRELLGDFMSGEGYECILAADAFDALEKFRAHPDVDLVMSDIRMPGRSGIDLLGDIKKLDDDVMVVMITAVKDVESAIAAMSKGAYDYVSKPFKLNEVAAIASKAIEKRHLVLENREYQRELERKVEARTIELRQALRELDKTYKFTLSALVTALDTRDTETQGHSFRVMSYTMELARRMELKDPEFLKALEYAALLHDIGKIGIPDAILRKPGKLSPAEWKIMKTHPVLGYEVLHKIKFLEESAQIVLHHHEHFDGSGYPDGLRGKQIPLGSRIFAVADAFDAMTTRRPYSDAVTFQAAMDDLQENKNILFDPVVVEAFVNAGLEFWQRERETFDLRVRKDPDFYLR
ncbi:MAG: response regulator [Acidobacteriota bacterium]|jgi:putative nucleotidyltransferase with HDIG domain|nr:response regulator [Acidobacteriota bacterium]